MNEMKYGIFSALFFTMGGLGIYHQIEHSGWAIFIAVLCGLALVKEMAD